MRPDIFLRKRTTPVTFCISHSIPEDILLSIQRNLPIDGMPHTVNAVSALHKWYKMKGSHDVIFDWRTLVKSQGSMQFNLAVLDINPNTLIGKYVVSKPYGRGSFFIVRSIEVYVISLLIRNYLQGSVFLMVAAMQCRNKRDCLIRGSAFEISAFEIIFDMPSLLLKVVLLIIPGWGEGYTL